MLHPLPLQRLKFVQFRNHSQRVVCVKLHILGGKEDFTLRTHASFLRQAVPVPENNLTLSLWTEAEPNPSLLSLYSCSHLGWMEVKRQCHWLILPCAPLLAVVPVPRSCPGSTCGTWALCSCSRSSSKAIRACEQTPSPLGDRWLKQELRNI